MLQVIRPSLRIVRAFGQGLWLLLRSGWETVIWSDVRAGTVALAGTARSFQLLIRFGLWLTIGLLVAMLFGDVWRLISPLMPLPFYTDALAGSYVPELLVPIVFGLLALAWAYLLCGALHAHWLAKVAILCGFGLFDFSLLLTGIQFTVWTAIVVIVHVAGWLGLLALFGLRGQRAIRLGLEFPLVLLMVTAMFFVSFFATRLGSRSFQLEAVASAVQISQALSLISTFLLPFLLIAGAEVAEFCLEVAQVAVARLNGIRLLDHARGRRLWAIALGLFLGLRLVVQWIIPGLDGKGIEFRWGALIVVLVLLVLYSRLRQSQSSDQLPNWVIPGAALLMYGVLFLLQVASFVVIVVATVVITFGPSSGPADQLLAAVDEGFGFLGRWNEIFVSGIAALVGLGLWMHGKKPASAAAPAETSRRQSTGDFFSARGTRVRALSAPEGAPARRRSKAPPPAARYAFLFAIWLLWWLLTRARGPLGTLSFQLDDVITLLTPILLVLLLLAALTRRLTGRALLRLSTVALVAALLEFQDVLADPLSPAFGLLGAEALFLSLAGFLGVMAAGNRFALNQETGSFPRYARGLLYFGYALLTVISLNWLAAGHQVSEMALNEQVTQNGFLAIGLPLILWALLAGSETLLGEVPARPPSTPRG